MNRSTEMDLMRRLHGELTAEEARELDARLGRDPELARRYARLRERWESLVLPPAAQAAPVPPGFTGRVMAHVEAAALAGEGSALSWSRAPIWVRAAAAAALVAGMALGASLSLLPQGSSLDALPGTASMGERVPLADSYWSAVEEETGAVQGNPSPGGEARP